MRLDDGKTSNFWRTVARTHEERPVSSGKRGGVDGANGRYYRRQNAADAS
jgi:hypothetical protein